MAAQGIKLDDLRFQGATQKKQALRCSALHHYIVNDGAAKELRRRPLSRRTSNTLWDLVQRGGGSFAGILSAFGCRVEPGLETGGRTFWILRNEEPVLLSVVCWDACFARDAFGVAERAYYDLLLQECCISPMPLLTSEVHAPAHPAVVPWLARVHFPGFHQLDPRETVVLDELERCMAWTLMTRSQVAR
jgi:hypothetical protein